MASTAKLTLKHRRAIINRIFRWFDDKQRDLPWLKKKTPYPVWVSEIMLQQTQITTVIDYYQRFIKRFPNVKQLATADVEEVLRYWEGLGYYRRARQMHQAARIIVDQHHGKFPVNIDDVRALPGIGRYTAAAVLSISLDQPHAILEGNTIRLFSRLILLKDVTTKPQCQKILWEFSESLLPRTRTGDFNQAVMDFGREICTVRNPKCDLCPLAQFCPTFVRGLQSQIPNRGNRVAYEDLKEAIVLIERNGKYLMRKCAADERWAGLWDFPRTRLNHDGEINTISNSIQDKTGIHTDLAPLEKTIKHAVTKYRIRLDCFAAVQATGNLKRGCGYQWKTKGQIRELPLSSTGRKFADLFVT